VDSLLSSLKSTLEANTTISTLGKTAVRVQIHDPDTPEPEEINAFAVVLSPLRRRRHKVIGGVTFRYLWVRVIAWKKYGRGPEAALTGTGTELGLDDFADAVELALTHSKLSDATLDTPDADEALGEGEYVSGESDGKKGLLGIAYAFAARRRL
jgi:hypothetical protein